MPVKKGQKGVAQELKKFKQGELHSGAPNGPVVTDPKQAIAIALHAAGVARDQQRKRKGTPPRR